jgi:hypothetical protein
MPGRLGRGSMLVVAMGVLALLSVMAVTFATVVRLEMASSTNYVNGIKAKFVAESGISYATVELRRIASARGYTDNSDAERERWIREDLIGQAIEDVTRGAYEGLLAGTYIEAGDRYRVKIIDCASQINLNTHYDSSRKILGRMLDNLAAAIQKKMLKNPLSSYRYRGYGGGEALLLFRDSELPGRVFTSKSQLIEPLGRDNFSLLEDYVTVSSWIDPQTLRGTGGDDPRSPVDFEAEPRAPVNINTATPEVLIACLTGLAGRRVYVLIQKPVSQMTGILDKVALQGVKEEILIPEPTLSFIYTDPITSDDASVIAERIIKARKSKPFKGWQDFYDFVDDRERMPTTGFSRLFAIPATVSPEIRTQPNFSDWYEKSVRSLLKANFNPNALPNRFNPNKGAFQEIDKFSLFRLEGGKLEPSHTTEFCFGSMGRFEIISLGEIAGPNEIVARSKIRKVVKLCEIVRHTTQAQFEEYVGGKDGLTRYDVVTYPEPCSVLGADYASRLAGYVEIKQIELKDPGLGITSVWFGANWDTKGASPERSLSADSPPSAYAVSMPPLHAMSDAIGVKEEDVMMKVGPLMKLGTSPYDKHGDLFTDGVNTSIIRHTYPRVLRYRAGVSGDDPLTGPSNDPRTGNVPSHTAPAVNRTVGLEFWFKPMFDATQEVIWGLCGITIVKQPYRWEAERVWTKGTQMFIFKNTDGVLRGTRLYFERAFDLSGRCLPTLKYPVEDSRNYVPSPDAAIQLETSIKYARTDAFVPSVIKSWKSNEWRHIAVIWNDTLSTGTSSLFDIYVDGRKVSLSISPPEAEGTFVTLNEKMPHDVMYVGGFERLQAVRAGVFKYRDAISEFCNGTIDGFRVFCPGPNFSTRPTPVRLYSACKYENRVPVIFPPNASETRIGNVSWTSYLPSEYHGVQKSDFVPDTGKVTVTIQVGAGKSVTLEEKENGKEISNLIARRGEPVKYTVDFKAVEVPGAGKWAGNAVCSPVFDDITFTYVLPDVEALEYEEIFE